MSDTKTIALRDADLEELFYFANTVLQLNVPRTTKEDNLRGKIMMAHEGDITVPVDMSASAPAEVRSTTTSPLKQGSSKGVPKVMLNIAVAEGDGGDRPVPVGVNGSIMLVPRGKDVEVPWPYYLALKAAVKTIHAQDTNTGDMESHDTPSYPFSVRREPPQEEIDAWYEKEADSASGAAEKKAVA